MRITSIAKRVVPLMALMAVMAVPSVASATYWGEYDYQPIGGSPTSEDPVTAEIAGSITLDVPYVNASATCDVVGEIELKNDWDHPSGSPATNRILSLAVDGSVGQSCTGSYTGVSCSLSSVTFPGLPWSGHTAQGETTFNGVYATMQFKGGPNQACQTSGPTVTGGTTLPDVYFMANGSGQGDCLDVVGAYDSWLTGIGTGLMTKVNSELWIDHDTIEGLSTDEGGPCVTINEA